MAGVLTKEAGGGGGGGGSKPSARRGGKVKRFLPVPFRSVKR